MACSQGGKRPDRTVQLGASIVFELNAYSRAPLHYWGAGKGTRLKGAGKGTRLKFYGFRDHPQDGGYGLSWLKNESRPLTQDG
jgi:hypothetical protein